MYISNKLFPGVIDTIPSDYHTRGHTFSQDLDWLYCGERWQSLHLLIWHIRSCMLCLAGANGMRSDEWQNKPKSHLFSRFGLDVLTNSSSAYMTCKKLYALLCYCQRHEKWLMTNNSVCPHHFSQDLDWLPSDNNDQVFICWYDTVYKKLLLCPSCTVYLVSVLPSSWEYNTDKQWQFT